MKSIKYLLPLVALAASGLATAATSDTRSIVVRYGDLNLNSEAGKARLHKRLRNAAESVCGLADTRVLVLRDVHDQCVAEALSNSVAAVASKSKAS